MVVIVGIRLVRVANMDKQKASKAIAKLLQEADDAVKKAVQISEASGVSFHLPWGGEGTDQRGMGASYYPEGHSKIGNQWDDCQQGWNPSAGSC